MPGKRIALITGANQGVGLQVAKELVAKLSLGEPVARIERLVEIA
jgi:NAD(P)-dependent dehydrogenase (short-subunit alcohol dehydrogenase family)